MKKIILRYGTYAALAELIIFILIWLIIKVTGVGHRVQGYIGWANLLCPLVFIYLGVRYYRDRQLNGQISFMHALKIGLLIMLLPAFAFALIETVYTLYIDPGFYDRIAQYDIAQYRKILPPDALAKKIEETNKALAMNKQPAVNFISVMLMIDALGAIVSVLSALFLMRKQPQTELAPT